MGRELMWLSLALVTSTDGARIEHHLFPIPPWIQRTGEGESRRAGPQRVTVSTQLQERCEVRHHCRSKWMDSRHQDAHCQIHVSLILIFKTPLFPTAFPVVRRECQIPSRVSQAGITPQVGDYVLSRKSTYVARSPVTREAKLWRLCPQEFEVKGPRPTRHQSPASRVTRVASAQVVRRLRGASHGASAPDRWHRGLLSRLLCITEAATVCWSVRSGFWVDHRLWLLNSKLALLCEVSLAPLCWGAGSGPASGSSPLPAAHSKAPPPGPPQEAAGWGREALLPLCCYWLQQRHPDVCLWLSAASACRSPCAQGQPPLKTPRWVGLTPSSRGLGTSSGIIL